MLDLPGTTKGSTSQFVQHLRDVHTHMVKRALLVENTTASPIMSNTRVLLSSSGTPVADSATSD